MSDDDMDRKLLGLLDSLSPEHVQRLKTRPQDSTEGPEKYQGVGVPPYMRPHWNSPQAMWWRAGVESARRAYCCAHCGGVIESTDFPECRGACGTEGSEQ